MKPLICEAFCETVTVTEMTGGVGVSSNLLEINGDPISIYAIGPDDEGHWRLDDAGLTLPFIEASGFDLSADARQSALARVLSPAGAAFDLTEMEIFAPGVAEAELPRRLLQFMLCLVRVADLVNLSVERVKSTFREDFKRELRDRLPQNIRLDENVAPHPAAADVVADVLLSARDRQPLAVFLVQSDIALMEAMLLKAESKGKDAAPGVAAVMERETGASAAKRRRALNRLDRVLVYEGDELAAVDALIAMAADAPPGRVMH